VNFNVSFMVIFNFILMKDAVNPIYCLFVFEEYVFSGSLYFAYKHEISSGTLINNFKGNVQHLCFHSSP
jgi:hypothetical protein